jgi:Ca2+-binding RTX toxin-like protein
LIIRNANNVTVIGNSLNNILTSEAGGNATLSGEGGNDKITGYLGNDTINGGAGNDIIIGSRGADIITGGLGADLFEYHAQEDSMFSFASDIIADFSHAQLDKIDVSIIDADATTVGINDAFTFIGNNVVFSNVAGQLRFEAANNTLYGDIDGNGTADIQITLTGVTNLVAGDFIL